MYQLKSQQRFADHYDCLRRQRSNMSTETREGLYHLAKYADNQTQHQHLMSIQEVILAGSDGAVAHWMPYLH